MRLLDLYCGAGGAAAGYARAGFEVVGVDLVRQPHYPYRQVVGDALDVEQLLELERFDAIHASPPCQEYSAAMRHLSSPQEQLIDDTRQLLERVGVPWILENVRGAPLPAMATLDGRFGLELCGSMFGLRVRRHRLFETSWDVRAPRGCDHRLHAMNPHDRSARERIYREHGRGDPEIRWARAMGVEWMSRYEAREAIPPAYTEWIGSQLVALLVQAGEQLRLV